jgi:hypothetical protein
MTAGVFQLEGNYLLSVDVRFAARLVWGREDIHGEGKRPNPLGTPGVEKSSISLFKMTPVTGSNT